MPLPDALLIRPANPADAPVILELIRELADYEKLLHAVEAGLADIERDLFGPQPRVHADLAVTAAGEPAGFALWYYSYSTFQGRHGIYVEDLYVRPAQRGAGIGRALLAALARRCGAEGLGRLEWSVLTWNEPAIGFYRRIGAVSLDEWARMRLAGPALGALAESAA